jgi:uncharacterized protein (TIGR02147 family)
VEWLQREFSRRESRNPRYSLRAFAQLLKVAPGALSEILASKRKLSVAFGERCAERLKLSPEDRKQFLDLLRKHDEVDQKIRRVKRMRDSAGDYQHLDEDIFSFISDWYHFAILSLNHTRDFKYDIGWIASRLDLTPSEVTNAIDRLERLNLITRDPVTGRWRPTDSQLTTGKDIPSEAIRRFHDQCLTRARDSLSKIPVTERDVTSVTMAIDPAKLPAAKEMIRHFRRQLAKLLEDDEPNRTEVYQLNIQFLPLSKRTNGGNST